MRLLIGERQKPNLQNVLTRAKERKRNVCGSDKNKNILHLLKLDVNEETNAALEEFLFEDKEPTVWQRIVLECCTGIGLPKLLRRLLFLSSCACHNIQIEHLIWKGAGGEPFPSVCQIVGRNPELVSDGFKYKLTLQAVRLTPTTSQTLQVLLPCLDSLELLDCRVGDEADGDEEENDPEILRSLLDGLSSAPSSLKRFSVANCQLHDATTARIVQALAKNQDSKLTELDFSHNECGDLATTALVDWLQQSFSSCSCSTLKTLHMSMTFRKQPKKKRLRRRWISVFFQALERNQSLTFLTLGGNHIDDIEMQAISMSLTKNSTLQRLHLNQNDIGRQGLDKMISNWQQWSLRTLWLTGNNRLEIGDLGHLATAFQQHRQTSLWSLEIPRMRGSQIQAHDNNAHDYQRIIHHVGEWNQGGRQLISYCCEEPNNVPVGLWPLVFERVNRLGEEPQNSDQMKTRCGTVTGLDPPSVLYRFLTEIDTLRVR